MQLQTYTYSSSYTAITRWLLLPYVKVATTTVAIVFCIVKVHAVSCEYGF